MYQFYTSGGSAPTVLAVNGITGTVLDVQATQGYGYALTTNGLYYWATATGTTAPTASLMAGTAGNTITRFSAFGAGGALVKAGQVCTWTAPAATGTPLTCGTGNPSAVTQIQAFAGNSTQGAILLALTATGDLYARGPAVNSTAWVLYASNVATFDGWGVGGSSTSYTGGVYVTTSGATYQFMSINGNKQGGPSLLTTLAGKSITQVFASDGTYLALASNGTVYAWGGNLDTGRGDPTLQSAVTNAADLEVWGYHVGGGNFYGGGYVITGQPC